ncbi:MFS transporter [Lederbergia wuyishanensis]|uniref:MFS family arabinose efflux permease n=1 Tax=Lederbergia wuyishanensis TaxID=1347903 RepID=A0ABU0D6J8_9BACI|nr:MFS transporter [Lederbergia wuyishanensis]MCJ8008543.1 MFS transporter [Lederbergia wuyishanensis]MDQ0344043.1 putative MFS family arabinose efflux permease [Lederbergia wuyishanensis]
MSELLKNRFVRVIFLSALFLQVGIWVRNFAVLLFVMEKTNGDAFAVSMISVAEFAPIFIFSFIGGTFADRWKPKLTMIWCDILSAISVFAVLITLVIGSWKIIFFATLISAILSQFSQPSGMKLFKMHLKPELIQSAMSIYQTIFAIFMVLGPVVGTFVFQQFGIDVSIAITGVSFLLSAVMLLFIPADHAIEKEKTSTSVLEEMKAGVRYVLEKKELKLLGLCFMAAGLAIGLIQPLTIFLVTERLELAKENLQWLLMANGIGMILGGALSVMFTRKVAPQRLLVIGMMANAIGMSVVGFSTSLPITLGAEFFTGLFFPCIQIGINTMILQSTKAEFIGRVNGTLSPLFSGAMVLTMSLSGILKHMTSIVLIFELSAILFVIGILVIMPIFNMKIQPQTEEASNV